MILAKKNFHTTIAPLTNLVFSLFPISFVAGNLIININLFIFCCLGIFHLRSNILTTRFNLTIKIIFLFFFIIFLSTFLSFIKSIYLNEYAAYDLTKLIKSLAFFRFFLMLLIVYYLNQSNILDFKLFFISASLVPILISLDVIYQYIFGFNIAGIKNLYSHNSSFFGDELIAGGYIKNFSFFSIIFLSFIFKNKSNLRFLLIMFTVCVLGTGILLSINRMPLILFVLGLFLLFLVTKDLKKILFASFLVLSLIFGVIISSDALIKVKYQSYFNNTQHILFTTLGISKKVEPIKEIKEIKEKKTSSSEALDIKKNEFELFKEPPVWDEGKPLQDDFEFFWVYKILAEHNHHTKLFVTALDIWGKNKILGNGIKSFREDCKKLAIHKKERICSNHPHNYYLEILTEIGILGLLITLIIGLSFIYFVFKNLSVLRTHKLENSILLLATICVILEAFPFKSTGSIFSTANMTYLVLVSSIFISYKKRLNI